MGKVVKFPGRWCEGLSSKQLECLPDWRADVPANGSILIDGDALGLGEAKTATVTFIPYRRPWYRRRLLLRIVLFLAGLAVGYLIYYIS